MRCPQFLAIRGNPDTPQLQEWWRNQRGTTEFLAQLEDELLVRAGFEAQSEDVTKDVT